MSLSVHDLSKHYGKQKAVDNISFSVKTGEIVGFLGPNGAGKSTTMKMVTGFLLPTEGSIQVMDLDVQKNQLAVKKRVGYLPENNPLYQDMYVKEYLSFIAKTRKLSDVPDRVEAIIKRTGLKLEQHKKIWQLSKGYRQRVGIAQALIHDPEVIILDEPTSGLDPNQVVSIRQLITELGQDKTVLLSTHIMQEVEALCDRVIIINKGKLIADQPTGELKKKTAQGKVISVAFKHPIDDKELNEWLVSAEIEKRSETEFRIKSSNPNIQEELFKFAVNTGNMILKQQEEEYRLEEVFQQLTDDSGIS